MLKPAPWQQMLPPISIPHVVLADLRGGHPAILACALVDCGAVWGLWAITQEANQWILAVQRRCN